MIYSTLLSAMVMVVAASPFPNRPEYVMVFDVGTYPDHPVYATVNLVTNGTEETYFLQGEQNTTTYPGTPFSFGVATPEVLKDLYFNLDGYIYNAGADTMYTGNGSHAFAAPVRAVAGKRGDGAWIKSETDESKGEIEHNTVFDGQSFYACQDTIDGEQATLLNWGIPGPDKQPPAGCQATKVYYNDNSS